MKEHKNPEDSKTDPDPEIVHRLAYTGYIGGLMVGGPAIFVGVVLLQLAPLAVGLLAFSLTGLCYAWLKQQDRFTSVSNQFDAVSAGGEAGDEDDERVAPLVKLLQTWAVLERKRGTPEFDPWASQSVRRDIQKMIDADPALGRLFHL